MFLRHYSSWRWIAGFALIAAIIFAATLVPLRDWLSSFTGWIEHRGAAGLAIFMAVYIIGVILLLPSAGFAMAAAIAYGFWRGLAVAAVSASIGAVISFLIARYFGRDTMKAWLAKSEKFHALDDIISENDWKIVFLCRLTPFVPFVVSNYLFGLTRLRFWPYFLASATGIVPGALCHVYLGYIGKMTLTGAAQERTSQDYMFLGLGLVATVGLLIYISARAKKTLREKQLVATAEK